MLRPSGETATAMMAARWALWRFTTSDLVTSTKQSWPSPVPQTKKPGDVPNELL